MKNYFKWKCMICLRNFNCRRKHYSIVFKDENIDKNILKKVDNSHLICHPCASDNEIKKGKIIACQFCHSGHTITEIKEVDSENNVISDCIII